jgi:hypothetical protein
MIDIRRATQKDAERWYGKPPVFSMKGYVAEKDGELLGIGGVFRAGARQYVFAEMLPSAHCYAKSILTLAKKVMQDVEGSVVYAIRQDDEPTAQRFLEHLGFKPVDEGEALYRRN